MEMKIIVLLSVALSVILPTPGSNPGDADGTCLSSGFSFLQHYDRGYEMSTANIAEDQESSL